MTNDRPTLSVVMPCFNEAFTVAEILRRVDAIPIDKEILVVDDGSTDGTRRLLGRLEADWPSGDHPNSKLRVLFQPANRGKGAAVRRGISEAVGRITLIQDADLEYDPSEYPKLVQPILDDVADVVFGSRFAGTPRRVLFYRHELGNRLLTTLSNLLTDLNLTDMETCYKAFRTQIIQSIPLEEDRFGFEPEVTAKLARLGVRIYEVPIGYHGRTYEEGKKIGWRDGVRAVQVMWRHRRSADATPLGQRAIGREQRHGGYTRDLYARLAPHLGERVVEIGADQGQYSRILVRRLAVVVTDPDAQAVEQLRSLMQDHAHVVVARWDVRDPAPAVVRSARADTFLCVNLLQRLDDDAGAMSNIVAAMPPGARLLLVVPAVPAVYGTLDLDLGWVRRYDRAGLVSLLERSGLRVDAVEAAHLAALLGWAWRSRVTRRAGLPRDQVRLINLALPLASSLGTLRPPVGQSWIVVATRPQASVSG